MERKGEVPCHMLSPEIMWKFMIHDPADCKGQENYLETADLTVGKEGHKKTSVSTPNIMHPIPQNLTT